MTACRHGVWKAAPTERSSSTTKINSVVSAPIHPAATMAKLAAEISRSEMIMIRFRLYRSMNTPINGPSTPWGRKPIIMAMVSTMAEPVWSVRYHTMANWRTELENCEKAWPVQMVKKFCFQLVDAVFILILPTCGHCPINQ